MTNEVIAHDITRRVRHTGLFRLVYKQNKLRLMQRLQVRFKISEHTIILMQGVL